MHGMGEVLVGVPTKTPTPNLVGVGGHELLRELRAVMASRSVAMRLLALRREEEAAPG